MDTAENLISTLKKRAEGTPYVIEANEAGGFTLKLDIVDTSYYLLMYKNGVKRAFSITGRVNADKRTVETTDALYKLDWQIGSDPTDVKPTVNWNAEALQGEVYSFERRVDLGIKKDGSLGAAVNYGYATRDAKKWLDEQLKDLGWRRVWGTKAKIGLAFGIIGGVGALLTVILLVTLLVFFPELFND